MKTPPPFARIAGPLVAVLLACGAGTARADADDTFSLTPAIGWMHDDNLFRLNSGALSDSVTTTSLTLKVDKKYSLQRFELETSYIDYHYQNYGYLNYNATPYRAAWHWSVTPELHGDLAFDRSTALNNFSDYSGSGRNINTTKNSRFGAVYDYTPTWHLLGGVSRYDYSNTEYTTGEGNNRVDSANVGLRYTPTDNTSLTYLTSEGRGEYYNRTQPIQAPYYYDNEFDERKHELTLHWVPTGKTSIDARLAHVERNHEHFASRDYGGTVGNVNFNWNYTSNSLLTLYVAHEMASYQTVNTNYTQTDRIGITPSWQLGGKTVLRLRYDYAQRDYLGTPGPYYAPSDRSDRLRVGLIALEWHPVRTATVAASLQNERRDSNQDYYDYRDNAFNINAQITF